MAANDDAGGAVRSARAGWSARGTMGDAPEWLVGCKARMRTSRMRRGGLSGWISLLAGRRLRAVSATGTALSVCGGSSILLRRRDGGWDAQGVNMASEVKHGASEE